MFLRSAVRLTHNTSDERGKTGDSYLSDSSLAQEYQLDAAAGFGGVGIGHLRRRVTGIGVVTKRDYLPKLPSRPKKRGGVSKIR